jgi:hypothetical protein
MEIESITELDLFIPFRERKQVVSMRDLSKLEGKIRAIPWLYFKLRKLVPYLNIFFSVERDFIALRLLDFSERSGIAVDVGFNDGISSVSIIKNSNLRVIAFEPLKIEMNKFLDEFNENIRDQNKTWVTENDEKFKSDIEKILRDTSGNITPENAIKIKNMYIKKLHLCYRRC